MTDSAADRPGVVYPTRRSLREARDTAPAGRSVGAVRSTSSSVRPVRPAVRPATPPPAQPPGATARADGAPRRRRPLSRTILSAVVMTFAAGLIATIALPSYAFVPKTAALHGAGPAAAQAMTVGSDVKAVAAAPDKVTLTSAAAIERKANAVKFSYSGKSAADYLKDPKHPKFSLAAVYATALKYRGVPYVFGGATPAGFDCSGFVMYVYAQYGISLAHSVHMIDAVGTRISEADAEPGDLVVFNDESHIGFYAGNGEILHAPDVGGAVRVQPLWSTDVHFIRLGI